jgi:hypothetical protein
MKLEDLKPEIENPLNIAMTGDAEIDSKLELNEVLRQFKQRAKNEEKRFVDATDSEYWFAVCFATRAEKEEFLEKIAGGTLNDKYINGRDFAKKLGITLGVQHKPTVKPPKALKIIDEVGIL